MTESPSAIVAAAQWIQSALLGTVALITATIAIAVLGFLMLQGRTPWKRGALVLLGCFILFGAPVIARGLAGIAAITAEVPLEAAQQLPSEAPLPEPSNPGYDPYAGASVPDRR